MKFNKEIFFDEFRPWFKAKTRKRVLSVQTANGVDFLLDQFAANPMWKDVKHVAYALATVAHETAWMFLPIKEYRAAKGTKGRANQDRYWLSGYYGRGLVQITWLRNYQKASKKLGIDLVKNPSLALRTDIAFQIMTYGMHEGWFTGKKLSDYINARQKDYRNARKIINGLDKAATLASYAQDFENMLRQALILDEEQPVHSFVNKTGTSQPVLEETGIEEGEIQEEPINEEPINEEQDGNNSGENSTADSGEAAPEDTAQAGEPVVGGRPEDVNKLVEAPVAEEISGWKTWPTTVTATLSGLGLSVGGIATNVLGVELSPGAQNLVGWIIIMGITAAIAFGLFYLISRAVGTASEKNRVHEIQKLELELASRPDRYNVKSVG